MVETAGPWYRPTVTMECPSSNDGARGMPAGMSVRNEVPVRQFGCCQREGSDRGRESEADGQEPYALH